MMKADTDYSNDHALNPKPTFQYISDLHLEFNKQYSTYKVLPSAPYLIIAGDIGSLADYDLYVHFLRRHCQLYKQIYLVPGNHEFHHLTHAQGILRAERLEAEDGLRGKLTVLHRRSVNVEGVILLGCTLWSHIPPSAREAVKGRVKDYQHIEEWSVDLHNSEHARDVQWLQSELNKIAEEVGGEKKVLVVTHHAPSNVGTSNPLHASNPWSAAFSTPLLEGEAKAWNGIEGVRYWIFGHTHWTTEVKIGGVHVVSNQRGYARAESACRDSPDESGEHVFVQSRTLEV